MQIDVKSDGVLEAVGAKLAAMPSWLPTILDTHLPWLGGQVQDVMMGTLEQNRYTGELADSVTSDYDSAAQEVHIGPTAKRGSYDGGLILELGTRPHAAPWGPIAAWAESKGLPAFPVWWKIRELGTDAHPFLQRTLDDSVGQGALREAARRIVTDAALEIVSVEGVGSIGITQS